MDNYRPTGTKKPVETAEPTTVVQKFGSGKAPMSRNTRGRLLAWALLLFIGTMWGATFSLAKIAADGGGHPIGIAYWQSLIGTIALVIVGLATGQLKPFKRRHVPFYFACGMLGTVVPGILYYYAASRLSPGIMSITIATVPLLTVTAAVVLGTEKLKLVRLFGVALGVVSIVFLVGPKSSLPNPAAMPWIFVVLVCAACYAAENLFIALRRPSVLNPFMISCGLHVAAFLTLTLLVISTNTFEPFAWPWTEVEWAIIFMSLLSVTAYSLFVVLITRAGPVFASQTAYIVTFSGVVWSIIIFSEQHSLWIWASFAVMMVALFLVNPRSDDEEI